MTRRNFGRAFVGFAFVVGVLLIALCIYANGFSAGLHVATENAGEAYQDGYDDGKAVGVKSEAMYEGEMMRKSWRLRAKVDLYDAYLRTAWREGYKAGATRQPPSPPEEYKAKW